MSHVNTPAVNERLRLLIQDAAQIISTATDCLQNGTKAPANKAFSFSNIDKLTANLNNFLSTVYGMRPDLGEIYSWRSNKLHERWRARCATTYFQPWPQQSNLPLPEENNQ